MLAFAFFALKRSHLAKRLPLNRAPFNWPLARWIDFTLALALASWCL